MNSLYKALVDKIKLEFNYSPLLTELHKPKLNSENSKLVAETIESSFVSTYGEKRVETEKYLMNFLNTDQLFLTSSGTIALIAALHSCEVQGTYVLTSNISFHATANSISFCGGEPIFFDVDCSGININLQTVEKWIRNECFVKNNKTFLKNNSKQISCIVIPHLFGNALDYGEMIHFFADSGIKVIDDAAEALGVKINDEYVGNMADLAIISFNGNKIVTAGGGGAIYGRDAALIEKARTFLATGKNLEGNVITVGLNGMMPALNASLLQSQLYYFGEILDCKRKIFEKYCEIISEFSPHVSIVKPNVRDSNFWLNLIKFESENDLDVFEHFARGKIATRRIWSPFSQTLIHRDALYVGGYNSSHISNKILCLPSSPELIQNSVKT